MSDKHTSCIFCGDVLTKENSVGACSVCLSCQSEQFKRFEEANGCHMAVFLTCAANNLPCLPEVCPIDLVNFEGNRWERYVSLLEEHGALEKAGGYCTFFDGCFSLTKIFGKDLSAKDFSKYIEEEKKRLASLPGTPEQRVRWGVEPLCRGLAMTDTLYDDLDAQFELWMARYRGVTDPQLESNIIKICRWDRIVDFLISVGRIGEAEKVRKITDNLMSAEEMRKKDEKPIENFRFDAQIVALEKAGLYEDGKFLSLEDTQKKLWDVFLKKPKYDYSADVADHMLLDFRNNLLKNADNLLSDTLPEDLAVNDVFGEFSKEETKEEQERKSFAKLTNVFVEKKKKDKK